jgi:hypothetical protein
MLALGLRTLYRAFFPSGLRTVYVAQATGSDSHNGTSTAQAYATIAAAVSYAQPGDRILVDAGTYATLSVSSLRATALRYISIESLNDSVRPIVSVADNSGNDGVDIQACSFIGLFGFEVIGLQTSTNTNPSAVSIFRGSDHIAIWNNLLHDFPGGGVNCFWAAGSGSGAATILGGGWDLVDISFNTIHDTSKYSPNNTSGISFYGAIDTTGGATWDGRYGYRAIGNYIYNVICTVPYTPGGFAYVTDGNGISIDSLWLPNSGDALLVPYVKRGLVEGNLVAGCGGRGLHIYNSINVDDVHNTYAGNLRTVSVAITNGVETDAQYTSTPGSNGVTHYGNLILPLNTPNTTDGISTYASCVILGGTQAVPSGNVDRRSVGSTYVYGNPNGTTVTTIQPISYYAPRVSDMVTRPTYARGYQALGNGSRANGASAQWSCGAIESPVPQRFIHHH